MELESERARFPIPNLPGSEVKKADEPSGDRPHKAFSRRSPTGKMEQIKQKGGIKKEEEKQPETRQDTQQKPNGSSDVQPGDSIKVGELPVKVTSVGKDGVTATDDKGDKHLIRHENVEPHEGEAKPDGKEESKDNSFKKPEDKDHPVIDEFKSMYEGEGKNIDKTWMVPDPKVDGVYLIFTHEKGIKDSPYKAHIFYRKDKDFETVDDVSSAIKKHGPESLKAEFDKKSGGTEGGKEGKEGGEKGKEAEGSKDIDSASLRKEDPKAFKALVETWADLSRVSEGTARKYLKENSIRKVGNTYEMEHEDSGQILVYNKENDEWKYKATEKKEPEKKEPEKKSMKEFYVIDMTKAQIKPYTRTRRGKLEHVKGGHRERSVTAIHNALYNNEKISPYHKGPKTLMDRAKKLYNAGVTPQTAKRMTTEEMHFLSGKYYQSGLKSIGKSFQVQEDLIDFINKAGKKGMKWKKPHVPKMATETEKQGSGQTQSSPKDKPPAMIYAGDVFEKREFDDYCSHCGRYATVRKEKNKEKQFCSVACFSKHNSR